MLLAATMLLAACDGPGAERAKFMNTDLTGLEHARDFALPDHHGQMRTLSDFSGKAVVVFFGFTQCSDVCPTTLAELAQVMRELGPLADRVQVLFVSVDPERDTPQILSQYVPAFDPRFLGLVGDAAQTDKVVAEFKVFYQKVPGKEAGSYTVDHSAGSYIFDPEGRVRLYVRHGQGAESIAHDLRLLLS